MNDKTKRFSGIALKTLGGATAGAIISRLLLRSTLFTAVVIASIFGILLVVGIVSFGNNVRHRQLLLYGWMVPIMFAFLGFIAWFGTNLLHHGDGLRGEFFGAWVGGFLTYSLSTKSLKERLIEVQKERLERRRKP